MSRLINEDKRARERMPWFSWLLNLAYAALLLAAAPVLLYRRVTQGKYRDGWGQKLCGNLPRHPARGRSAAARSAQSHPPLRGGKTPATEWRATLRCLPTENASTFSAPSTVWFHAVSVGEVLQLQTIIKELRAARPQTRIVVSTTTATGHAVAQQKFPDCTVCYFPLDFTWAVRRAIRRVRPDLIVLVELELWPNFIFAARAAGVPLALVNGRIGDKSFRGYRRLRPLVRQVLCCFDLLAAQNETYAARLVELGAPRERVQVTGSIKFDHVATDRHNPKTAALREAFGIAPHERVFIAGSTQDPEEQLAVETWLALRDEFPHLRLVLVPRHQERFEEVARVVEQHELPLLRRSQRSEIRGQKAVGSRQSAGGGLDHELRTTDNFSSTLDSQSSTICLLDTLGELAACWGLADVAFVGGSLTQRGGQNMIEPAAYGAAVLFGPNTWNFKDVAETLLSAGAARVVNSGDELTAAVRHYLQQPAAAEEQGRLAQQLVLAQQGATARTAELLEKLLPHNAGTASDEKAA